MSKETKGKKPKWLSDINDDSVKKSLDAGVILPRLKPRLNQVYEVTINSELKSFEHTYGTTYNCDVIHENMEKNLIIPKSFKFQLTVELHRHNLMKDGYPDFNLLFGKTVIFQKTIGDTKEFKNVELYSCQIK